MNREQIEEFMNLAPHVRDLEIMKKLIIILDKLDNLQK